MRLLRFGETSLTTLKAISGHWGACCMKLWLWSLHSELIQWINCLRKCAQGILQRFQNTILRIYGSFWSRCYRWLLRKDRRVRKFWGLGLWNREWIWSSERRRGRINDRGWTSFWLRSKCLYILRTLICHCLNQDMQTKNQIKTGQIHNLMIVFEKMILISYHKAQLWTKEPQPRKLQIIKSEYH